MEYTRPDLSNEYDLRQHRHKKEQLRIAFSYPLENVAYAMDEFVMQSGQEAINTMTQWHSVSMPIDYSVSGLSPFLFADYGNVPRIFDTIEEVYEHMSHFREWHREVMENTSVYPGTLPQYYDHRAKRSAYAVWTEHLENRLGIPFDPAAWTAYCKEAQRQVNQGYHFLDLMSAHIGRPDMEEFNRRLGVFEVATGRHRSFLVATTSCKGSNVLRWNQLPIGEYGPIHTERLLRAAGLMIDFMEQDPILECTLSDIYGSDQEVRRIIQQHTLRFHDATGKERLVEVAQEGVQQIAVDLLYLSGQQIAGYEDDPDRLLDDIVRDNMVDKHTQLASLGTLGGLMLYGAYIPDLMQSGPTVSAMGGQQHLHFGAEAIQRHKIARNIANREISKEWLDYEEQITKDQTARPPVRFGDQCTFAGQYRDRRTGDPVRTYMNLHPSIISLLAKVMVKIYHQVEPVTPNDQLRPYPWQFPLIDRCILAAYAGYFKRSKL